MKFIEQNCYCSSKFETISNFDRLGFLLHQLKIVSKSEKNCVSYNKTIRVFCQITSALMKKSIGKKVIGLNYQAHCRQDAGFNRCKQNKILVSRKEHQIVN